jgi:hypothetical protein
MPDHEKLKTNRKTNMTSGRLDEPAAVACFR